MLLPLMALAASGCGRKSIDEQFEEAARQETQQTCPWKMDEYTTLDSIVYNIKSRTQIYYYTVTGEVDDEANFTENYKADRRETMLKSLRNEIRMKKLMDAEVNIAYVYISESQKKPIFQLTFTKNDYTGPIRLRTFDERITGKWEDYTTRLCPEQQDECTVLDSVVYRAEDRTLYYSFSLMGELDVEDFDEEFPDAGKEMKKFLVKGIRQNETLAEEKDSAVSFVFRYHSQSSGRTLMNIEIEGEKVRN